MELQPSSRLYGVPLTDLETVRKYTDEPELALIVALNTWVQSVLTNEWFHADVHAGTSRPRVSSAAAHGGCAQVAQGIRSCSSLWSHGASLPT